MAETNIAARYGINGFASDEMELIRRLPESMSRMLVETFLFHRDLNVLERKSLSKYFRKNSYISRVLMENPSTFRMLEAVYDNNVDQNNAIDIYLSNSLSGQALRDRLSAVTDIVRKMVAGDRKNKKIANLGSGPGYDTITVAKNNPMVSAVCIDTDRDALTRGAHLAKVRNVNNIEFIESSLMSLSFKNEIDIGVMIGILCGLEKRNCVIVLKKVKKYFRPGGKLIVSNISTTARYGDPFMAYLLENVIGWKLVYKTTGFLREMIEEAGYKWDGVFYDEPNRFHSMAVCSV